MSAKTDLTPTPESPGLHVVKPHPRMHAVGSYICGSCKDTACAQGDEHVWALIQDFTYFHGRAHTEEGW
ncbi:hypothetical protein OG302_14555 [Streptomyces sp. NBC_01283]|uniref:hypothetical protein n=1 Tax=Streptomyces sp. NBC_01283 TaxID=2903812 RepID=UPI00352CA1C3|nr:hypothetical protein OG302_14555 [Streptomyces sp. NBC_01283]